MKKTIFIKNAAVMTVSSLILRLLGTVFKIWVAAKVGSAGMGLYSLVVSVFVLVSSFAQSGISTAVTKLTAVYICRNENPRPILRKSIILTEIIAGVSALLLFLFSPFIANKIIGESSIQTALRALCISLPFVGVCSCLRGYFIAARKAGECAASQITEQAVRIFVSFFLVSKFLKYGAGAACTCLIVADALSEAVCCAFLYLRYKRNIKKCCFGLHKADGIYKKIITFSLPLTLGRYLGTLLRTAENLLVPKLISKSGAGKTGGLSIFGNIKAMALPVMLFPSSLLGSVSLLLLPEISAAKAKGRMGIVRCVTEEIIKLTMIFSCFFASLFGIAGREIGLLLYKSNEVGFLICVLSPIVPLMYFDTVCDGILKGLDCQNFCFFVGIADSFLRLVAVILTLSRFGITAFIIIMYFSNFLTAFLNTGKLIKITNAKTDVLKAVFIPLTAALLITKITAEFLKHFAAVNLVYIILLFLISLSLYCGVLFLCGVLNGDDIKAVIK